MDIISQNANYVIQYDDRLVKCTFTCMEKTYTFLFDLCEMKKHGKSDCWENITYEAFCYLKRLFRMHGLGLMSYALWYNTEHGHKRDTCDEYIRGSICRNVIDTNFCGTLRYPDPEALGTLAD